MINDAGKHQVKPKAAGSPNLEVLPVIGPGDPDPT
jgi:hypothetical protein